MHRGDQRTGGPEWIAVLIREYAAMVGLSPVSVLAVLATVIAMPTIRKQQVEKQEEA